MTVGDMRDAIRKVYLTKSWWKKVETMYDDQVIAIYNKFLNEGKLNKILRIERPFDRQDLVEDIKTRERVQYADCEQLNMFDLIK